MVADEGLQEGVEARQLCGWNMDGLRVVRGSSDGKRSIPMENGGRVGCL